MRNLLRTLFGQTSNAPYFADRRDDEAERLLLEAVQSSRSLKLGNGIVHGMRMPWDQARRVIEKLKSEGKIDYELPHDTWIKVTS